jgi:hypothetical protein
LRRFPGKNTPQTPSSEPSRRPRVWFGRGLCSCSFNKQTSLSI